MLGVLAIASAVAGLVGAGVRAYGTYKKNEAKRQELTDAKNQLTKVYNEQVTQAKARTKEKNDIIDTQIKQTQAAQETAVKQSSTGIAMQDVLYSAQIADLQIQASQGEGSAVQAAAVSGFRGDAELGGSIGSGVRSTSRAAARAISQAQLQARANRLQSYNAARNSYTSAEDQKELYRLQQDYNNNELQRNLDSLQTDYDYQYTQLDDELTYMNSSEFKLLTGLGIGADLLGSAADAGTKVYEGGQKSKWW